MLRLIVLTSCLLGIGAVAKAQTTISESIVGSWKLFSGDSLEEMSAEITFLQNGTSCSWIDGELFLSETYKIVGDVVTSESGDRATIDVLDQDVIALRSDDGSVSVVLIRQKESRTCV